VDEAISHFRGAIALLSHLPDDTARGRREIDLQLALADTIGRHRGGSAVELPPLYRRVRTLSEQFDETPSLIQALRGLGNCHGWNAEFRQVLEISDALRRVDSPVAHAQADMTAGWALHWLGEFPRAVAHLRRALESSELKDTPRVAAMAFLAIDLFNLGYPTQAPHWEKSALAYVSSQGDPLLLALAQWEIGLSLAHRRDHAGARSLLEPLMRTEYGYRTWVAQGGTVYGYVVARDGDAARGLAVARESFLETRALGQTGCQTTFLALVAQCAEMAGELDEAFAFLKQGIDAADRTGERWHLAEMFRLRGDWLLRHRDGQQDEAISCFRRAIEIARQQEARMPELRASVSLARYLQKQQGPDEARAVLAPIYAWFTEGFDTPDLKDAKALLDELA